MAALGPSTSSTTPSADAAGLLDAQLASGEKYYRKTRDDLYVPFDWRQLAKSRRFGYRFVYIPHRRADGVIEGYSLTASPLLGGEWDAGYYYTDQTGVIRYNSTRPATAQDPPFAG